jgi:hypothetical protein
MWVLSTAFLSSCFACAAARADVSFCIARRLRRSRLARFCFTASFFVCASTCRTNRYGLRTWAGTVTEIVAASPLA